MSEMLERVARAIVLADEQNGGPPWEALTHMGKHVLGPVYDRARSAIAAIIEPTETMISAAEWVEGYAEITRQTTSVAAQVWRDMAGAILAKAHVGHGNDT